MSLIHGVNDHTFSAVIAAASGLVLVDFWAPWCAPCLRVAPTLERLAEQYRDSVTILKANVDESPVAARRFDVRSIPSILFFRDGVHVDTVLGAAPYAALASSVERHMAVLDVGVSRGAVG